MSKLEQQLRNAARRSGLSMLALSRQSGVPYAAVHRFVAGGGGITLATAGKLARVLGLELRPKRQRAKRG